MGRRVSGSALLLCLILLSALTLLGLAAASDRQLQARVAGNIERTAAARESADAALAWAEDWLFSLPGDGRPAACAAECGASDPVVADATLPPAPEHLPEHEWTRIGHLPGVEPVSGAVVDTALAARDARWLVAEIAGAGDDAAPVAFYRVLAWGRDPGGLQVAVNESIVARPWGDAAWSDPLPLAGAAESFCRARLLEPCGRLAWQSLR